MLALGMATTLLGLHGKAAAQPPARPPLTLTWSAPAGCPQRRAVQLEVARLLGEPRSGTSNRVEARAQVVERGRSDWVLTLRTVQAEERGERVLEGSSCLEVARAGALILAFTIDPDAVIEPGRPGSARDALVAEGRRPPRRTTPDSAHRSTEEQLTVSVAAHGLAGLGLLPGLAWGVGGAATLRWRRLGLTALGHYWFEQTAWLEHQERKGGDFDLFGAGAALSMTLLRRPILLDAFVGAEIDHLRARGRGVEVIERAKASCVATLVGTALQVPLSRHAFAGAGVHAGVPSSRRRFELQGLGPVYRPSPVNGRLALGLGWVF